MKTKNKVVCFLNFFNNGNKLFLISIFQTQTMYQLLKYSFFPFERQK